MMFRDVAAPRLEIVRAALIPTAHAVGYVDIAAPRLETDVLLSE